jgi:release factor glutamine methyltransferase
VCAIDLDLPFVTSPPSALQCSGSSLYQWRTWALTQAAAANIPAEEVDWFLQGVTDLRGTELRLGGYRQKAAIATRYPLATLTEKWQQRVQDRVPVQYLVGETPWRQFMLTVTPAVLIPRPETELIVEIAEELVARSPQAEGLRKGIWVDLGTGSGAIAIGLADVFPAATIIAVDCSEAALEIARHNAERNGFCDRIQFRQGSWFEPLAEFKGQLAGIVSNPPYIPSKTVLTLQPEVTDHEPHQALDGGDDGLDDIRHLVTAAPDYLQSGGLWLIEMMQGQADTVPTLLTQTEQYTHIQIHDDLAGIQRFASATCL